MESYPPDNGNLVMKSMPITLHGSWGTKEGCKVPSGLCLQALTRWQESQDLTYPIPSFLIPGQEKEHLIKAKVLAVPGCPTVGASWNNWIKRVQRFFGTNIQS